MEKSLKEDIISPLIIELSNEEKRSKNGSAQLAVWRKRGRGSSELLWELSTFVARGNLCETPAFAKPPHVM